MKAYRIPDDFYVYTHTREGERKPFYVGMGSGVRAFHLTHNRSLEWERARNGSPVVVRILAHGLTLADARRLEDDTIALERARGTNLANKTLGFSIVLARHCRSAYNADIGGPRKKTCKPRLTE